MLWALLAIGAAALAALSVLAMRWRARLRHAEGIGRTQVARLEELERLAHYIDEAKILLNQDSGIGQKMDFIAQEMQRETNTIGSKVQDKEVAAAVVAIKSKVEKIREQSNNVE